MIDEKDWLLQQQQALDAERRMLALIDNLKQQLDLANQRFLLVERRITLLESVAGEMQRKGGG